MSHGPLIDTHCHLTFPQFAGDLPQVLARAARAGLEALVTVGVDPASSREAVALAGRSPDDTVTAGESAGEQASPPIYAAVGVHPHDAAQWGGDTEREFRELASLPGVVAVGETGLDYYRDLSPRPVQRRVFEKMLSLAREVDLPVIIHIREAHDDALAILEDFAAGLGGSRSPGVLHCFSGGVEEAARAVRMGFFLGFGGPITYGRRPWSVLQAVPRDRLLLETDCPYLTPAPYRGRRNEPAHVPLIAQAMADALGIGADEVARFTTANARRFLEAGRRDRPRGTAA